MLFSVAAMAQNTSIQVTVTADNTYAIYTGTDTAANTFQGSDNHWEQAETYNFNLPSDNFIYVVTYSDLQSVQGFLAQFTNQTNNSVFYSDDSQWQVTATGIGPNSQPPTLENLTDEIQKANAGQNASLGWVAPTLGPNNGAFAPWKLIQGIDTAARWTWYNSQLDTSSGNAYQQPPFSGFNHDEYLIFRIAVSAVPEPESLALAVLGLGLCGVAARKRGLA
jgi:hypothetical protein